MPIIDTMEQAQQYADSVVKMVEDEASKILEEAEAKRGPVDPGVRDRVLRGIEGRLFEGLLQSMGVTHVRSM